jgi:hypothetical protein
MRHRRRRKIFPSFLSSVSFWSLLPIAALLLTVPAPAQSTAPTVPPTDYPSLHNLLQLTEPIYSGAEPHDDTAFENLHRLGSNRSDEITKRFEALE